MALSSAQALSPAWTGADQGAESPVLGAARRREEGPDKTGPDRTGLTGRVAAGEPGQCSWRPTTPTRACSTGTVVTLPKCVFIYNLLTLITWNLGVKKEDKLHKS